jgi:uncharacterized protein YukJ
MAHHRHGTHGEHGNRDNHGGHGQPQGGPGNHPHGGRDIYSLLKGTLVDAKPWSRSRSGPPHYHLQIEATGKNYDVAINIASTDPSTDDKRVLYLIRGVTSMLVPNNADALNTLAAGFYDFPDGMTGKGITGLDYTGDRDAAGQPFVTRDDMKPLPLYKEHRPDSGQDAVMLLVQSVKGVPGVDVFLFGHKYDTPADPQSWLDARLSGGIHNIHMNQGNYTGNHDDEDGRHTDGGLLLRMPTGVWRGLYIAFPTQSWDNDTEGYPNDDPKRRR